VTLNIESNSALRRPSELQGLVRAVLHADPADEPDWIEWKSSRPLTTREGQADAARHILGFANRHPDRAGRNFEGCGYLLIGVQPGKLFGTERIDPAELEAGLRRYLGDPGPQWSFHNVSYQERHVALFVVEPPRWGDPIYCLERDFASYQAGTVFVRRRGSTHAASPADMRYLQERLLRRADYIQVEVGWREAPAQVTPLELGPAAVEEWISAERAALLAPLSPLAPIRIRREKVDAGPKQPVFLERLRKAGDGITVRELEDLARRQDAGEALTAEEQARLEAAQARLQEVGKKAAAIAGSIFSGRREDRSEEEYRQEVENYLRAARESIAQAAVNAAMKGGLIRLQPMLSNHTERNFPKVEVELYIAAPVIALDYDPDARGLPPRPRLFGTPRPSPSYMAGGITSPRLPRTPASSRIRIPEVVIDISASARLRYLPVDLRPMRQEQLAAFHLAVRAELAGQTLPVSWTATSSGADGLASGSLAVEVRSTSAKPSELLDLTSDN
jgi:hypothetical protein